MPDAELMKIERRNVTLLFADLRGFTSVCQEMEAEEVCEMINEFLSNMVECIEHYDGTIDKFVGDEIMAVFEGDDMVIRAVKAAEKINRTLKETCRDPERGLRGNRH